jgi:hypothetical protein
VCLFVCVAVWICVLGGLVGCVWSVPGVWSGRHVDHPRTTVRTHLHTPFITHRYIAYTTRQREAGDERGRHYTVLYVCVQALQCARQGRGRGQGSQVRHTHHYYYYLLGPISD